MRFQLKEITVTLGRPQRIITRVESQEGGIVRSLRHLFVSVAACVRHVQHRMSCVLTRGDNWDVDLPGFNCL